MMSSHVNRVTMYKYIRFVILSSKIKKSYRGEYQSDTRIIITYLQNF